MLKDLAPLPIPHNEFERLRALDSYRILDTLDEKEFDRLTQLASIICDVPISLVSLVDEKRQWFKSHHGLDARETPRELAFCQYAIMHPALFEVHDATRDKRFDDNALVTGDPNIRFYAGMPLIDANGYALGTLCVIDRKPKQLSNQQTVALQLLAGEAMALIEERRKKMELKIFEQLFDSSDDLLFVGRPDGYFEKVNPAFTKLLGWSTIFLLNTPHFELLHPDDLKATQNKLEQLAEGQPCSNFVQRFRSINGDYKTIQWTSSQEPGSDKIFGMGRDITEQYQLEEELKYTKEMLEQTNQVARVGGWSFDMEKKKIYWTPVTKEIHGVPTDFIPDMNNAVGFYAEGESQETIRAAITMAIKTGASYNLQLQLLTGKGELIWVRAIGNAEMENGKCKRLFGTFQDINDFKLTELALKESVLTQDRLNHVLLTNLDKLREQDKTIEKIREFEFMADVIPQLLWTAGADGQPDYYNRHWIEYTGMTIEETINNGWETILHPEDKERSLQVWADAVSSGSPYEVEYRFRRAADQVYKWHLGRALPMKDENGRIIKWFGSCTDIDEYKRALALDHRIGQYEEFNRIVAHNLRGPAGSIGMITTMLKEEGDDEVERVSLMDMLEQSSRSLNDTLEQLMKVLEVRNNHNLPYDECDLQTVLNGVCSMLRGQMVSKKAVIKTELLVEQISFPKIYLESIVYNMVSNALKYSKAGVPPELWVRSELVNGKVAISFKDNGLGLDLEKHGKDLFKLNKVFHAGHDSKGIGLFMTKTQIETFGGSIRVQSSPGEGCEFIVEL